MKSIALFPWTSCVLLLALISPADAAGPITRVPNTTLQLPTAPPTFGFKGTNDFGLFFTNAVCLATPPGETNRLFVLEKRGRIIVITNLANPTRKTFMDITDRVSTSDGVSAEEGLLGLAFHPGYATNRFFYVFYTGPDTTTAGSGRHDILSRFTTSPLDPNAGAPSTEVKIIRQRDDFSNHNAGDVHFGPDGYLYVSLGDEGDGNDTGKNSQRITNDFFSAIIRIDVDKRAGNLTPNPHPAVTTNYLVPADNPFVGATSFNGNTFSANAVRTEFWAVGLRNPWRWNFDEDGTLYCGDVGQSTREEIDIIEKGKNYGWNYWEGFVQRTNSAQIPAEFVHAPPLLDYNRSVGATVIGGRVYRGQRLAQLFGAYVYADSASGRVWAMRHSGTNVTENVQLFTEFGISAFGVDPRNGDLLYCYLHNGTDSEVKRIIYNNTTNGTALPATLSAAGAFSDLTELTPQPGIIPYDINVPFWSDNAIKTRWVSVPNTNLQITFNPDGNWSFPTGTVWIKHFELELTNGVPESRKRLETRFIVKNPDGVYGVTYRWGDSTTDATLVPEEGMDEPFVINDSGNLRTQIWHYPSRSECLRCHTEAGGFGLGFNTAQLNRDHDYAGGVTNQITALSLAGYFNTNVSGVHTLRSLAHHTNEDASLEYRVRSYLAANCSQCHQPDGPAGALWDARITTTTQNAGIVNGPLANSADTNLHVITPGSLAHSVLLQKISTRGPGQMPPIDSTVVDTNGVALISAWITNDLPSYQTFAEWQAAHFGSTNSPESLADADPDSDGAGNYLEFLTSTDPTNSLDSWTISISDSNESALIEFPQLANRAFQIQSTSNLLDSASWTPLDIPGNEPFFSISNRSASVPTDIALPANYYRVRVIEP